jgi:NitT/TauT family transport system ATP-binding protein
MSPQVVARGIGVTYSSPGQNLTALDAIDFVVEPGEFVSILGPSGCGKSTLLRVIGGLQKPTRGSVTVGGEVPRRAQSEKQIGFIFQDPSLLPWRTVRQNVDLPRQLNRGATTDHTDELIDLVGLAAFASYYPFQLSGGMQQRVALARALVTSPSLLLMDEPFGALDEITRSAMRYELLRLWRAGNQERTVVFVTHSVTEAVLLSDRVIVMTPRPGKVATTVAIDLPRPRSEDLELEPEFLEYVRELRSRLRDKVAA